MHPSSCTHSPAPTAREATGRGMSVADPHDAPRCAVLRGLMGEDAKVQEKREPPRAAWLRAERLGLPFASEDHGWARRWRTGVVPRE